jgi:hypothetical protein
MKKVSFAFLVMMAFFLNACASTPPAGIVSKELVTTAASPTQAPVASQTVELSTSYENAVSVEMQLLLGIFKLEGSDQAVTKEQAGVLAPLWTNFKTLSQSLRPERGIPGQGKADSTPQAIPTVNQETQSQMEALIKEILSALTPEQIQAISAMKITQETATTVMQEQGITLGGPQQGKGNPGQPAEGTPPAGGPGGGDPPPAGGQQPGGNGQMSTPPAGGGMQAGANFLPGGLIDALIKLLQNKAG